MPTTNISELGHMMSLLMEGRYIAVRNECYVYKFNHERKKLQYLGENEISYSTTGPDNWRDGNGAALSRSWEAFFNLEDAIQRAREWHLSNQVVSIPATELAELKKRKAELEAAHAAYQAAAADLEF